MNLRYSRKISDYSHIQFHYAPNLVMKATPSHDPRMPNGIPAPRPYDMVNEPFEATLILSKKGQDILAYDEERDRSYRVFPSDYHRWIEDSDAKLIPGRGIQVSGTFTFFKRNVVFGIRRLA